MQLSLVISDILQLTLILNLNSLLTVMLVGMVSEQYCHNAFVVLKMLFHMR